MSWKDYTKQMMDSGMVDQCAIYQLNNMKLCSSAKLYLSKHVVSFEDETGQKWKTEVNEN